MEEQEGRGRGKGGRRGLTGIVVDVLGVMRWGDGGEDGCRGGRGVAILAGCGRRVA